MASFTGVRPIGPRRAVSGRRAAVLLGVVLAVPGLASAQTIDLPGVVVDAQSARPIEGVSLFIVGTSVSAASAADGSFVLPGLSPGQWTVRVYHLAYGEHEHELVLFESQDARIEIRMAQEAIELEPIVVDAPTPREQAQRARGSSRNVITREQIEAALGGSRHLGDLISQTVPGIRIRQSNDLVGTDMCLEFRSGADLSMLETRSCNHPLLLLDGVPVSSPNFAYGTIGLNTIQRIEVLPPGEAGARYGSGSLYGVLIVETRDPRPGQYGLSDVGSRRVSPGRSTFDWSQDPGGHPGLRTAGSAFLGTAIGLVAGVAVGGRCFDIDDKDQIVTSCSDAGNAAAGVAAFAIPAITTALAARLGGRTESSVGRVVPGVIGASMALLPGFVYSLSTVGEGSETANAAGAVFLLVGTPLAVTVADKLFRSLR